MDVITCHLSSYLSRLTHRCAISFFGRLMHSLRWHECFYGVGVKHIKGGYFCIVRDEYDIFLGKGQTRSSLQCTGWSIWSDSSVVLILFLVFPTPWSLAQPYWPGCHQPKQYRAQQQPKLKSTKPSYLTRWTTL